MSIQIEFDLYVVPKGEGGYDFTAVAVDATGNAVKNSYCRF